MSSEIFGQKEICSSLIHATNSFPSFDIPLNLKCPVNKMMVNVRELNICFQADTVATSERYRVGGDKELSRERVLEAEQDRFGSIFM